MNTESKSKKILKNKSSKLPSLHLFGSSKGKVLHGSDHSYKVCQTLYMKPSKKGKVCLLKKKNGEEIVGKFVVFQKQHQVIFECYFLNMLRSKSICNFIELIRSKDGYWIVMEKGKMTLLDYLPKLKSQDVFPILRNIVKAYKIFYKHQVSHRDLKLSNIVIEDDQEMTIKFIDLELCEKNDHVYGTIEFLPPQIARIDWSVCDSYAFGLIAKKLCECSKLEDPQIQMMIRGCTTQNLEERWNWEKIFAYFGVANQPQTVQI